MTNPRTLHVGLRVRDLDSSLAFYNALGYQMVGRVPATPIGQLVMLKLAADEFVTLELVHDPDSNPPVRDTHFSHLVIAVDSMADFVTGLQGVGIDVQAPTSPDGTDDFLTAMVYDPDGNSIELVQWPVGHPIGMTAADFTDDAPRDLVDLCGVATWWDEHGTGEPVVLLHPGGADSRAWDANVQALAARYRVLRYDRRGQGRTPDIGGSITFENMTDDAITFLELVVGGPAHLIGHSIGAPLALLVARRRPDLVRSIVFSEGVSHHDGWKPGVLDPLPADAEAYLAGLYGEVSPHGPDHWSSVWARLDAEHHRSPALTSDDLANIETPTLLLFADDTSEVADDHIRELRAALPNAQLAIVPDTDHGLPVDRPDLYAHLALAFLASQP
jgi:pimeloyl-ACP methyl ester carboxylesterase